MRRPALPASSVLDGLEQLVDHSLLVVREDAGEARYRLLETVRQYALERLREAGEESSVRAAAPGLVRRAVRARRARTVRDAQQRRGWCGSSASTTTCALALGWSIEHNDASRALRLAAGLWKFWEVRGHATEGQRWLEAALALGRHRRRRRARSSATRRRQPGLAARRLRPRNGAARSQSDAAPADRRRARPGRLAAAPGGHHAQPRRCR